MIGRTNVCGGDGPNRPPAFTYTGTYTMIDDSSITGNDGDWRIKFTSSGTLNITDLGKGKGLVDIFCVGGGAGGRHYTDSWSSGAGGGGGYTRTALRYLLTKNTNYSITVGSGGAVDNNGNQSSFNSIEALTALGGYAGSNNAGGNKGGNGGSGGAGGVNNGNDGKVGGADGADGGGNGGTGQGSTTKEFGDSTGTIYGDGGSSCKHGGSVDGASAGHGGGAARGNGSANTGGGGGGDSYYTSGAGKGGSGIVILRNHRS